MPRSAGFRKLNLPISPARWAAIPSGKLCACKVQVVIICQSGTSKFTEFLTQTGHPLKRISNLYDPFNTTHLTADLPLSYTAIVKMNFFPAAVSKGQDSPRDVGIWRCDGSKDRKIHIFKGIIHVETVGYHCTIHF